MSGKMDQAQGVLQDPPLAVDDMDDAEVRERERSLLEPASAEAVQKM
jgi:hypothetical protein